MKSFRLAPEINRAIAKALAYKCQAGRGTCHVEGGCPFDVKCVEVEPLHWIKALGCVSCKKVKSKTEETVHE